jgi:hypothetical protein
MSSSNGMPASNYNLTFAPTQAMFVAGTSVVVANSSCATDANGAMVGMGNPLTGPIVNIVYTGTLPINNYYIKFTWYDTYNHETLPSPEIQAQLTSAGQLQISPPSSGAPLNAIGMNVYIGVAPGAETYQGQTLSTTSTFNQSIPLTTSGGTPHITNTTVCQIVANDAAWPVAGYNVTLSNAAGQTSPGFPQQWQLAGPGSTYNISQGLPLYNGRVTYPVPVLTTPLNHNMQSISSPLAMGVPGNYYPIVGVQKLGVQTMLPAWGVDVEGTGLASEINANGGYLVNGNGGSIGQCLASDGTAYDVPTNCITSIPPIYYQTVRYNGVSMTQQYVLSVGQGLTALNLLGPPGNTQIAVNGTGSELKVATAAAAGVYTHCAQWDAYGGIGDAGGPCASGTSSPSSNGYVIIPASPRNIIVQWGSAFPPTANSSYTVGLPITFPGGCLQAAAWDNGGRVASGNASPVAATCNSGLSINVNSESSNVSGPGAEPVGFLAIGW